MVGYPNSLDTFPNPTASTKRNAAGYELHEVISNLGDAAEALEQEVGVKGSGLAGLNPLINGGFDVWQDGATFTGIASGTWGADQWLYQKNGAMVHDLLRSTDVPTVAQAGARTNYSLHLDVTTADTSIASSDYCMLSTRIEGHIWRRFDQQVWSIGFWVKGSVVGLHALVARNSGDDRSCVVNYPISVADTWEYKTVTFPASPTAGTWDFTNGRGIDLAWVLAAGSGFQTTAGAWQTGNFLATSVQVNETSSTANNFRLAMVGRPTLGTVPARWQPEDEGFTLYRCCRYNESIGGAASAGFGVGPAVSTTQVDLPLVMVPKRAASPSIGALSGTIGNLGLNNGGATVALTAISFLSTTNDRPMVRATVAAGLTATLPYSLISSGTDKLRIQSRIP